jgi:transposase-like protein
MAKSKTSKRYTPEFRRQMVELARAGRTPGELSKEFGPTKTANLREFVTHLVKSQ